MKPTLILLTLLTLASCGGGRQKDTTEENNSKSTKENAALYVDTLQLQKQVFNKQILCNGKLRAVLKSDIVFPVSGVIASIPVKNGVDVSKGALLAKLDTQDAEINLSVAKLSMNMAEIDLYDKLIGQGYGADTTEVPKPILNNAKYSSGYSSAVYDLEAAHRALEQCYIYAPFAGRVANLDSKIYDKSGDVLCTLINDSDFDVEFNILEAELMEVAKGQAVSVTPFVDESREFKGFITEINPMVDENGQIIVRAKVRNQDHFLIEGMNVKLTLNREIKDQYVVPKSAVVLRDGFNVVFRYVDGEAVWTYVTVVMSNISSHLITGHEDKGTELSNSDIIITSGNRNLADGVKVNIK